MEYRYKTSYATYDDDFDKAVNHFPKELFDKFTNYLKVNVGKNVTANQSAQIAVFIIRSIELGDEHENIQLSKWQDVANQMIIIAVLIKKTANKCLIF